MSFKKLNDIVGWIVFVIATTVYVMTVEETASFWDCGEFIAVSYKLMVPHPPGAPFFLLIGRMFSFLAMGDVEKVAYWVNMISVLSSSFSILFLYWSIVLLGKKLINRPKEGESYTLGEQITLIGAGLVGSLAYTFSDSFWFSAVEAEVYGMSSFFTAFVVWAMLKWETIDDRVLANKWLILIAYMMGLSIGVHLLNLVTIPALGLVYYYKRYPQITHWGLISTMVVSGAIIILIMYLVIPGLPSIAGKFEIFFVNGIGLPFGSGALFFAILFLGAVVYGIIYSIKKQNEVMNTALLGFAFVLIGYASYGLVLIRSNHNPPIDENNPEDVMSFVSYLKREQYGDRPLLYGRSFASERIDVVQTEPMYRKGKDKYEIYDYKTEATYEDEMLLPRMYSQGEDHPELYRDWARIPENRKKPNFIDNVTYLFRYQLGHMYFRYFLWNFAGRDGDDKEAGWLLPNDPSNDEIPEAARNKARDNFYMLPLILGLLGLFFQLSRDEKNFAMVMMLFFLTGIALVLYMNSPPVEPRERDYIYVGSFYAFAMWIGFGVIGLSEWFKSIIKNNVLRPSIATALCMVVPIMMGAKGWDNHNRSNRFHSIDQARNTLASCAPNAVLFTGGDNDTFPLWYVQDVEGYRTDVRVVVLSYLSTDWYIEQLKRKMYNSEPLPISLEYDQFKSGANDYIPYLDRPEYKQLASGIDLKTYMKWVKESNPNIMVELQGGGSTASLPSKNFVLGVDSAKVAQMNILPENKKSRIVRQMRFSLRQGAGALYKSDLMILDMLASCDWKRPLYFNNTSANTTNIELRNYLQMEGLAYRIVPYKTDNGDLGEVEADIMYENIKKFQFRGFDDPNAYHDEEYKKFGANERNAFYRLAYQFFAEGKNDKAKEVLEWSLKQIPDKSIPYDYYIPRYVELFHQLGEHKRAENLADTLGKRSMDALAYLAKNKISNFSSSSIKDRSLLILNQLSVLYGRAVQREEGRIEKFEVLKKGLEGGQISQGDFDEKDLENAKERLKLYQNQYKKFNDAFEKLYEEIIQSEQRR
ncbi:MAG: DUF2723 domain-containing protein [Thermoflexibacter sp.]|jgi:hypothetical protein|nr:DUF2723 domain-containing protein [Thermoflexibacter sp.]